MGIKVRSEYNTFIELSKIFTLQMPTLEAGGNWIIERAGWAVFFSFMSVSLNLINRIMFGKHEEYSFRTSVKEIGR